MVTSLLKMVFGSQESAPAEAASDTCSPLPSDRRLAPRFEVRDASRIFVTRRPLTTVVVDVSMGGARFATRIAREVGTVVGLELTVDGQTRVLPLRVLWDRWNGAYFEHGGAFVQLTEDEQGFLRRYLAWAMENPPAADVQVVADTLVAKALEAVSAFTSTP